MKLSDEAELVKGRPEAATPTEERPLRVAELWLVPALSCTALGRR
jgi:hypothetical protein